jgi:hypothetical protein
MNDRLRELVGRDGIENDRPGPAECYYMELENLRSLRAGVPIAGPPWNPNPDRQQLIEEAELILSQLEPLKHLDHWPAEENYD